MTISAAYSPDTYAGDASTTVFAITFAFLSVGTNVKVSLKVDSTGVVTLQTTPTLYSISGSNVTMVTAPASGETLIIELDPDFKQTSDYTENSTFPADTLETDLDERTLEGQINNDISDRSIKLDSDTFSNMTSTTVVADATAATNALKFIQFNAAGTGFQLSSDTSAIGSLSSADGTFYVGDGTTQVAETGNTARTSMGVGTGDSPTFTSLTLTGDLSVDNVNINGNTISSTNSNGNITFDPNGTGDVDLTACSILVENDEGIRDDSGNEQLMFTKTATAVNHTIMKNNSTGNSPVISSAGTDGSVSLTLDTQGSASSLLLNVNNIVKGNYTSSGFQLGSTNSRVTTILDEDNMATNSATALATQQSIKAYADTKIADVVDDTTPQLGADLDANAFDIQFDDATGIRDDSDNEQLIFQKTTTAVNYLEITNAAAGNNPQLSGNGSDADVGIDFNVKAAGTYDFKASASGAATLKLLEDSDNGTNSVALTVADAISSNVELILPSANDTLVGKATTDTFTNKTFDANGTGNSITNIDLTADVINDLPVAEGGTASSTASGARTNLGVAIGSDVQAFDADLTELATGYTSEAATTAATFKFLEGTNNGTNGVTLAGPASTADVTVTLPAAADTLVGKATTDTLANKSIAFGTNTVTGTKAEFDTAVTDGNIAYSGGAFHDGFSDFVANEHIDWTSSSTNFSTTGTAATGTLTTSAAATSTITNSTNNQFALELINSTASASPFGLRVNFSGASPDNNSVTFLTCVDSTANRCLILADGDLQNHDNSYGAISDERLKSGIKDSNSQWADIRDIPIRKYKMKTDIKQYGKDAVEHIGVVAQEISKLGYNGLVMHNEAEDTYGVQYSLLYMKAVKALQEALIRIEKLEDKVIKLEDK